MIVRIARAVRVIVSREELTEDPSPPPRDGAGGFLKWLLAPESLPRPAVSVSPDRTSFWRWLFMPDELPPPDDAASPGGKRSVLALIFSGETLPRDPVPEKGRGTRSSAGGGRGGSAGEAQRGRDQNDKNG